MPDRVQRQPAGFFGGIVAQLIGCKPVTQFVEGDAYKRRNNGEEYVQQNAPVQPLPYGFQRIYKNTTRQTRPENAGELISGDFCAALY